MSPLRPLTGLTALMALMALMALACLGCDSLFSDCTVHGTGKMDFLNAASVDGQQFDRGGSISVDIGSYADVSNSGNDITFPLPGQLYAGRRGSAFFGTGDPLEPTLAGVVDWEITAADEATDTIYGHSRTFTVKMVGAGFDEKKTTFHGTCPVKVDDL